MATSNVATLFGDVLKTGKPKKKKKSCSHLCLFPTFMEGSSIELFSYYINYLQNKMRRSFFFFYTGDTEVSSFFFFLRKSEVNL